MYELIRAGENTYYIDCPTKAGIFVRGGGECYLFDSGIDKDVGKKLLKILDAEGWHLSGVIVTHSHADHVGANALLTERTGCKIFAPEIEGFFTRYPLLEPSLLWSANPPKELKCKLLLAKAAPASGFDDPDFPKEIEVIPLPGHYFGMAGYRTPDNVVFLGDSLFSEETLAKYALSYMSDPGAFLDTLDKIPTLGASLYVPCHAPAVTDPAPLCGINREKVFGNIALIKELLATPMTCDDLLSALFTRYGREMTVEQYALTGSTLRGYLSYLSDKGEIRFYADGTRPVFVRTDG